MDKIKEMGEGIVVEDAPVHRTTLGAALAKGKRSSTSGKSTTPSTLGQTVYWSSLFS